MQKTVKHILGVTVTLAITGSGLFAANTASDSGSTYLNPWGPVNPQFNPKTGFASWVFETWNPPTQNPPKTPFFIDQTQGAWGINVPAAISGTNLFNDQGYDAVWVGFTGNPAYLTQGQTFSTTVLFTVPGPYYGGPYGTVALPTEGIDFFAQSSTVPDTRYGGHGHQVLGIYLGPSPSGPTFSLAVHNSVSDENPAVYTQISIPTTVFNLTHNGSLPVDITFKQLAGGNWTLTLVYHTYNTYTYNSTYYTYTYVPGGAFHSGYWITVPHPYTNSYSYWVPNYITLNSGQYGLTWNTAPTEGIDAARYFTSQGGVTPGGPLEWQNMSVK